LEVHTLNVHAPLLAVEVESGQRSRLAEPFGFIDELIASIISSSGISLRVLVCQSQLSKLVIRWTYFASHSLEHPGLPEM
jgi:hypothetical protein